MQAIAFLRAFLAAYIGSALFALTTPATQPRSGSVVAWGWNNRGQATVPRGLIDVIAVAAGQEFNVALKSDGTVVAWGDNALGQTNIPAGLSGVKAIAAGAAHAVALKEDGSIISWGGLPPNPDWVPQPSNLGPIKAISAGAFSTFVLKQDSSVALWGLNSAHEISSMPPGVRDVKAIEAGSQHFLVLKEDGTILAWGAEDTIVPASATNVAAIAAGWGHNVVLRRDGTVVAWGSNLYRESMVPPDLRGVIAIAAGVGLHTVALKGDGTIVAWGDNRYGQTNVPARLTGVIAIAAGTLHTVAIVAPGNQTTEVQVTTLAGSGAPGSANSTNALEATLNAPDGPSVSTDGTIYFAETRGNLIRYLTPDGQVRTLAGAGRVGYLDGMGTNSFFSFPNGTLVLFDGDVLVSDTENDVLRKITGTGFNAVNTFAGDGARGYINGPASSARFSFPNDMVEAGDGTLYVSEFGNHVIRKITRDGHVSTLAGDGTAGYADGRGTAARFNQPGGLTLGPDGNLYVTEFSGQRIRRVTPGGDVSTFAGTGVAGFRDGRADQSQFSSPNGIVADAEGNLYVSESANHTIRVIRWDKSVSTIAGAGRPGYADGDELRALFNSPGGLALASDGSLVVADTGNNRLRRVKLDSPLPPTLRLLPELNLGLTIFGEKGKTYRIESKQRVGLEDWVPITNITLSSTVLKWVDPRPARGGHRMYRAIEIPQ